MVGRQIQASCDGGGLRVIRGAMVVGHCNGGGYRMAVTAMVREGKAAMGRNCRHDG